MSDNEIHWGSICCICLGSFVVGTLFMGWLIPLLSLPLQFILAYWVERTNSRRRSHAEYRTDSFYRSPYE